MLYLQEKLLLKGIVLRLFVFIMLWLLYLPSVLADNFDFFATVYPPYELKEQVNGRQGFDLEVVQAIFDRLEQPVSFTFMPWKRAVRSSERGLGAGILSCSADSNRDHFLHLSDPISYATQAIAQRKQQTEILNQLVDLRTRQVAAIAGFVNNNYLKQASVGFVTVRDPQTGLKMLGLGRFDVLYVGLELGQYWAQRNNMSEVVTFRILKDVAPIPFHLCFNKRLDRYLDIADAFNHELQELKNEGKYQAIHQQYSNVKIN